MFTRPIFIIMEAAARKASDYLIRDFNEVEKLQVREKSPGQFVTQADYKVEEIIVKSLQKAKPSFGIVCEENTVVDFKKNSANWIIDPIDGTTNFIHSIPFFAISIALEMKGEIVAGLTFNPILDECFYAEKNQGAYLNNRRLHVSKRSKKAEQIVTSCTYNVSNQNKSLMQISDKIIRNYGAQRNFGSTCLTLAYLAAGKIDGYFNTDIELWDMASGLILIQEAGGYTCDFNGQDRMLKKRECIATGTRKLKDELLTQIKESLADQA